MIKRGLTDLPLHTGKCPAWLFSRMKRLSGEIAEIIINEYGTKEFLHRISDPYFFQALGSAIGFDWHSSGLTVTTTAALKESINERDLGIKIAGGKGKTSRKTPEEIKKFGDELNISTKKIDMMTYNSRMSAKIDNSLLQDSYELYHHAFFLTEKGRWAVIQQGMNTKNNYARRYHWLYAEIKDIIEEPHKAICSDKKQEKALNMTSKDSREARKTSIDILNDGEFERFAKDVRQRTLLEFGNGLSKFRMPERHHIRLQQEINIKTLRLAREYKPRTYEELVSLRGVGPKSIRALALISELVYGDKASWKDPVKYSFTHGGKDGIPYPVDKKVYDDSIDYLKDAIRQAKAEKKDKLNALRRLTRVYSA
ncbi:MAG TPA: DUF763 domain-containing protein [Candidatus Woesearchaeota archaeon]|nr:MAG: DUF763 domain-containing protein [Candidatus Woesearchaeota archaeon]HDD70741.1 DUF763 domain-containing protein [Candidatus Woesearchaeota archaeon]